MDKDAVWKYYGEVAKELGKGPVKEKDEQGNYVVKKDEQGKVIYEQKNYSLQFFYENILDDLISQAPLFSMFMGDENAIDSGQWNCNIPLENEIAQWLSVDKKPYANQIQAICYALSRPLTIIQGPPGTGKTEMILNLLSVIHGKFPNKTVAVVSANNEAIKNITVKIEEDKEFSNIKGVYAQWGNNEILSEWQKEHGKYKDYFYKKKRDKGGTIYRLEPQILTEMPLFSSTIHSLRKIFVSKESFTEDSFESDTLFDYVIVDECSQVSTLLGLVAMGSAKEHLILIGDNEQLAPVIDEKRLADIEKCYLQEDVPKEYRVTADNTFLKVCEKIFKDKAQNIMLNEHYRCHPAIIGFCNEHVYGGELIVQTMNDDRFPIRVLWYEGEYSEYVHRQNAEDDTDKKTLQNMRQIEIFVQEEWPLLRKRMEENMSTSICVIAPYRGQLAVLEERLKTEIEHENNAEIKKLVRDDLEIEDEKEGLENKIPCLTIHKAQGKGFDIVCFLSVCDYDTSSNGAWAQRRRMINVVVSRAKKEFHLIVCNRWLPEEFQKNEIGYVLPHPEKKDDYYLIKMTDYTYRKLQDKNLQDGDFGFHKSNIDSMFDYVPLYRENSVNASFTHTFSAPEKCMRAFLVKYFSEQYKIYREVPLSEIYLPAERNDSKLKEYIENGSRIDFLVCKDKKVLLAIEVDGAQHRRGEEKRERNDELKNRYFEMLEGAISYLRISTDGSGCWKGTYDKEEINILSKEREIQKMNDYLDKTTELPESMEFTNENRKALECTEADKDDLLNYYKDFLNGCMYRLIKYMFDDEHEGRDLQSVQDNFGELKNTLPFLRYIPEMIKDIDYSRQETDDYYFCKFGIAYAFEYAMLYEIMLRIHDGNRFGVYSFGCGGYIDVWALAYARAKLKEEKIHEKLRLFYQGADLTRWKTAVFGEAVDRLLDDGNEGNLRLEELPIAYDDIELKVSDIRFNKPQLGGIQNFEPKFSKKMQYNVLIFPKLLNELNGDVLENFIKKLEEFDFLEKWVYYICVSHSPYNLEKGEKAVEKIVEMFKRKGYECEDDLEKMLDTEQYEKLCNGYKIEEEDREIFAYKCYVVGGKKDDAGNKKHLVPIYALSKEFKNKFENNDIQEFLRSLYKKHDKPLEEQINNLKKELKEQRGNLKEKQLKKQIEELEKELWRCQQMGYANIYFQIIKLTITEKQN